MNSWNLQMWGFTSLVFYRFETRVKEVHGIAHFLQERKSGDHPFLEFIDTTHCFGHIQPLHLVFLLHMFYFSIFQSWWIIVSKYNECQRPDTFKTGRWGKQTPPTSFFQRSFFCVAQKAKNNTEELRFECRRNLLELLVIAIGIYFCALTERSRNFTAAFFFPEKGKAIEG